MDYIKAGIVAGVTFVMLDSLWLGVIARSIYKSQLGELMRPQPNWLVAGCVYLLMVQGFVWFVFPQMMMVRSVINAIQYGARFGAVMVGVYQLTNYATIVGWPVSLVFVDTLWGTFLYSAASVVVYYLRDIF